VGLATIAIGIMTVVEIVLAYSADLEHGGERATFDAKRNIDPALNPLANHLADML
jgi:hypothetical protein